MSEGKRRLEWIDLLRGLASLFVIFGHIANPLRIFMIVTGPIKIPMFFAITGYVFNENKTSQSFYCSLFRHIIIPWVFLSLILVKVPIELIKNGLTSSISLLIDFLTGKELWYIPCCIIAEIMFFYILKKCTNHLFRNIIIFVVSGIGLILSKDNLGNFMTLYVACTSLTFVLIGRIFRENENKLRQIVKPELLFCLFMLYVILIYVSIKKYPGVSIDVHHNSYYDLPLCLMLILTGICALFLFSPSIRKNGWIGFVGRNSLSFYILHYHARKAYRFLRKFIVISFLNTNMIISYLVEFIFVCLITSIATILINHYFPVASGKSSS